MLGKQAKTLTDAQIKTVLTYLEKSSNASRDKVILLLSLHGLRAKEISHLETSMVTTVDGEVSTFIALQDKAAKGTSGRIIPMNKQLQAALRNWLSTPCAKRTKFVISTNRSERFKCNGIVIWFRRLYRALGFEGASSHSGRRTFLTQCARNISRAGGSIRDVMALAGHKHLSTTQRYVEQDAEAQRQLVNLLYK
jgi:integrase/recombinase XerD